MNHPPISLQRDRSVDAQLAELIEQVTTKLQQGEPLDFDELAREHPHRAEQIRQLLPALEAMADLRNSVADGSGAVSDSETAKHAAGRCLGDFRIIREIGRGGMGIVYEAEQISLGRRVALKVLPFAAVMDAKQLQRFKNEAHAAAQLHHTNIVPVFFVGCERGVHFYAMQFIEGPTLAELIGKLRTVDSRVPSVESQTRDNEEGISDRLVADPSLELLSRAVSDRSPMADYQSLASTIPAIAVLSTERSAKPREFFRTVARLGIQAAEALNHAHESGIIHRDIKPSNLLLDVRGNLWITDFGLARLPTDASLTVTGDILGTLRYMSPEQALATRGIDHRSDIYSLGVTLYEVLTLRAAFNGQHRQKVLHQLAFDEPEPPRRLNESIPQELETIVLKAMSKEPEGRYATAQDLADDLRRFLLHEPIRAKRAGPRERLVKWARRHRELVRAGFGFLALAILGAGAGIALVRHANHEAHRQRGLAELERARSADREALVRQQEYSAMIRLAWQAWNGGNVTQARQLLVSANQIVGPEHFGPDWNYLWDLVNGPSTTGRALLGHSGAVHSLVFSPDAATLATAGMDGKVRLWNVATATSAGMLVGHTGEVNSVTGSADGKLLVTASDDRSIGIWDAASRQLRASLTGHRDWVGGAQLSPDGRLLASFDLPRFNLNSELKLWDAATGEELAELTGHSGRIQSMAFTPDGATLITAGQDKTTRLWDVASRECVHTFGPYSHDMRAVSVSPDGTLVAAASGAIIHIWNLTTLESVGELRANVADILTTAFSPDGSTLASAGADTVIRLWDTRSNTQSGILRGHSDKIWTVKFSPDGKTLASASADQTARLWDVATPSESSELTGARVPLDQRFSQPIERPDQDLRRPPKPPGLIGWWPGDCHSNDLIGGDQASLVGDVTYGPGKVRQAIRFGTDYGYAYVGSIFPFLESADASFECWLLTLSMGHQSVIWTRNDDSDSNRFHFFLLDGRFGLDYISPTGVRHRLIGYNHLGTLIPMNAWTHVAVTRSGNTYAIFVNGSLAGTATDENPELPNVVGWRLSGRNRYEFRGSIDELSLYNRALTTDEIQAIYVSGQAQKSSRM